MSKDILLGAFYQDSTGLGVTGLTVTIDIWRVALADLAKSEIVTAGSVTEIGDGVYAYRVASADLQTYYYFGVCKTAGTVAQSHLAAVQLDFADSPGLVTLIWNALTSGMSTAGSIGKRLVDYLTGDVYARLGAPAGASIAADLDALPTANENADALLDRANGVETSVTPRGALRLMLAALAGKLSGAASSTVTIRNVGDSKNRITATVDSDGNRSAVTTDVT